MAQPDTMILWLGLGAVLGACFGSAAALLADRLPRGQPVGLTRSACRGCGAALRWWELVPLASALWLRGQCARCGVAIPAWLWQAELAGVVLGMAVAWLALHPGAAPLGLFDALAIWVLLALGLSDLRSYRLPDSLTAALLLLALVAAVMPGIWPGLRGAGLHPDLSIQGMPVQAALGAAVGAGLFWGLAAGYRALRGTAGMGAGDVRLMAGIGALVWPHLGPLGLAYVTLIAGLSGLMMAALRAARRGRGIRRGLHGRIRLPFGACLALAAIAIRLMIAL
ncbi:MAG: prepilin peptidase [Rhodobacteraceae bacterium]|nr:prepilin peptidase [Paracoccaceae bacterium]